MKSSGVRREAQEGLVGRAQSTPTHGNNFRETLAIVSWAGKVRSAPPTAWGATEATLHLIL